MRKPPIILQVTAALLVLLASGCGLDWSESYEYNRKDPFDLYVLHQLMEARPGEVKILEDSLPSLSGADGGNYLFVGNYAYYNERDITHLLDFVERGNNAFIAADELPEELAEMLYGSDCFYNYDDYDYQYGQSPPVQNYDPDYTRPYFSDTARLTLEGVSDTFRLPNIYRFKAYKTTFSTIPEYHLCDPELDNLAIGGIDSSGITYVRLAWGEGNFYFNCQPKFFTNYYLVEENMFQYAEQALGMALGDGPIFWDEASRIPPAVARQRRQNRTQRNLQGRNLLSGNEALSYIQNQPSLALAWYLLIAAVLLYVFFRGKRRQRIIPIINQRENSSKRFIDTLSRLVFQKGNHAALARQELRSLRFFLQDRYGIRWQPSEPLPENFAELTGASPEVIRQAEIEIKIIHDKIAISETNLIKFHRAIEPLYQLQGTGHSKSGKAKPRQPTNKYYAGRR